MEFRKPFTSSMSTVLTIQDREHSTPPHCHSSPQPPFELASKLEKMKQLKYLLHKGLREQEELKAKQQYLSQELEEKQIQMKNMIKNRMQYQPLQELHFQEQQSEVDFGDQTFNRQNFFVRTNKHQFYSTVASPKELSPCKPTTEQKYKQSNFTMPQTPRMGLIRKQSQRSLIQSPVKTKRPLFQQLQQFRTMRCSFKSIDELWNECEPRKKQKVQYQDFGVHD